MRRKVALIAGGDSGIGRAVAIAFAREGADVAIVYLNEHQDAKDTQCLVEKEGRRCLTIAGDVGTVRCCEERVRQTVAELSRLDILVNNAAEQYPQNGIEHVTAEQLERTFRTNIFSFFNMTKAALPHLREGSAQSLIPCLSPPIRGVPICSTIPRQKEQLSRLRVRYHKGWPISTFG